MSVYFSGGELRIDDDGQDAERALLFGTLLMDPLQGDELREEYLGFSLHDDSREPLIETEARIVVDEVELIKRVAKERPHHSGQYKIRVADDVAMGATPNFMKKADIQIQDSRGLLY